MPRMGDSNHFNRQPRVPKGFSGGGRWTDGDDQGERTAPTTDATGRQDGVVTEQFIDRENGAVVQFEFAPPGHAEWDERYTVTLRDGGTVAYEIAGPFQRIYQDGQLVRSFKWTESGPVEQPLLQLARGVPRRKLGEREDLVTPALSVLSGIFAGRGTWKQGGRVVALSYDVEALLAAKESGPTPLPRAMTEKETREFCKMYGDVQQKVDEAATLVPSGFSQQQRGTFIHTETAHGINQGPVGQPINPNYRAEFSLFKTLQEMPLPKGTPADIARSYYGANGTIRVDVLENVDGKNDLICVYDIKTGNSHLSVPRMLEIAKTVARAFPTAKQILVVETNPQPMTLRKPATPR